MPQSRPQHSCLRSALLALLAGCSTVSSDPSWIAAVPTESRLAERTWAAGRALLANPLPDLGRGDWRAGDRLVFGLEAEQNAKLAGCLVVFELLGPKGMEFATPDGNKLVVEFTGTVNLTITESEKPRVIPISTKIWRVKVQVRDLHGKVIAEQDSEVARTLHERGVRRYVEAALSARQRAASQPSSAPATTIDDDTALGYGVLLMLFQTFMQNSAMRSVLDELAAWPPWYRLPRFLLERNVTITADFEAGRFGASPLRGVDPGGELLELPLRLIAAGAAVLEARVMLARGEGPIGTTAGVVAMAGYQPGSPERAFRLQLIGIGRGAEPPKPQASRPASR